MSKNSPGNCPRIGLHFRMHELFNHHGDGRNNGRDSQGREYRGKGQLPSRELRKYYFQSIFFINRNTCLLN